MAQCYVQLKNGVLNSFIDPHYEPKTISFMARGRKPWGYTYVLNRDLKAVYNYQMSTLKLYAQAMIHKRVSDKWQARRGLNWLNSYDVMIDNCNVAWIYREGSCLASFYVCTDNTLVLEYFLETQIKLIERYINPRKSKK